MTVFLNVFVTIMNIIYLFYKILPIQNKIVMISRQSNEVNIDFNLLGEKLSKKYKIVYLCKTLDGGVKSTFMEKICYFLHMFKQMYHLATSKVCILDSYCPIVSILHHKKQLKVIQIWHSIGTMKMFGYTSLNKKEGSTYKIAKTMKMHKNYDMVCASSNAYKQHLQKGFDVEASIIKIFTLPRVDLLKDKKYENKIKNKIYKKYPELKEKTNVLYAPTFRKNEESFNRKLNELIDNIDFSKYNLIIKQHPLTKIKINDNRAIIDNSFSTFDMLFITDKLISDYSCIIYEAGIRNIPLYFYDYDIEKYEIIRGLAIDYDQLPGYSEPKAKDIVDSLSKPYDIKYLKKFIKKYVTNTNNCTKKLVSEIERYMKNE